ncbi:MAG: gliding motility lipoprotein GldD [Paludibacteraceae bacterium]|nr:gliding motility lipoprotein GldD [Paludibacteraceae bacterium]
MRRYIVYILLFLGIGLCGCRKVSYPRPYGYRRIVLPEAEYVPLQAKEPYTFEQSRYAQWVEVANKGKGEWMNLHYDVLNADIHCSYMPIKGNLRELTDDAVQFVYKHVSQASSIPERSFVNEEAKVYGVFFILEGNTASPYQFFLTDSTEHFFRGAAYCNCRPNADSLQPVLEYLEKDIEHLIETFAWK